MIEQKFVDLFANGAKVNLIIAERDVLLTYCLKILEEETVLDKMALKGGTMLRKCIFKKQARFSLDLDFTYLEKKEPDDIILEIASIFNKTYYDITFTVDTKDFYVSNDKLSCGARINYHHAWRKGFFEFDLSLREEPILPSVQFPLINQSYFKCLEFSPPLIKSFQLEELLAEKIRASYQRVRARDIYDLDLYALKPLKLDIIRTLVVLKFWNVRSDFIPQRFFNKLESVRYDWTDLQDLISRDRHIEHKRLVQKCLKRYNFLGNLTEEEKNLLKDVKTHKKVNLRNKIVKELNAKWR